MPKDPSITVPYDNVEVCDWFDGFHECQFAILSPFIRATDEIQELFGEGISRDDLAEKVQSVSWADILQTCSIPSCGDLNVLLQESIGAIRRTQQERIDLLYKDLAKHNPMEPDEGEIPELLLDRILRSFRDLGYKEVTVGDEWGSTSKTRSVNDMLSWEYPYVRQANPCLFSEDRRILYGDHWDSFYTFCCGPREVVTGIAEKHGFEGFFFGPGDRVYWGKP